MRWPEHINSVICGDAIETMKEIPAGAIQMCCTSPPYWGLRDYGLEPIVWGGDKNCKHSFAKVVPGISNRGTDDFGDSKQGTNAASRVKAESSAFCIHCKAWRGNLGLEPTPELYVQHLVEIFREVRRVLRGDGTLWLNLGDSYVSARARWSSVQQTISGHSRNEPIDGNRPDQIDHPYLKDKDLAMIPARVALSLQKDGWWLRSVIIWNKPSCMPESVIDRPTTAHEYVYLLTKSADYYYDADAIREPHTWIESKPRPSGMERQAPKYREKVKYGGGGTGFAGHSGTNKADGTSLNHPLGRNKRTVWTINPEPTPYAHFATFPQKLVEPPIMAGSRPGDIVLDPFSGSATVGVVAKRLLRNYILIDLNAEYNEKIAKPRLAQGEMELKV